MHIVPLSPGARPICWRLCRMTRNKRSCLQRLSRRYELWKADMTLRHCWFRVLLHLCGMARCPSNIPWHWRHIVNEFHARKPRT